MSTRLKDLRIKTLDQAKTVMARIAKLSTRIELLKARANAKISTIKSDLQSSLLSVEGELNGLRNDLADYIESNRGQFEKPRKLKCEGGEFGLQAASGVNITDETALMDHLLKAGYDDCYEVKRTPNKKAIADRLKSGCALPGVSLASGDTVVIKVDPQLIKDARNSAD